MYKIKRAKPALLDLHSKSICYQDLGAGKHSPYWLYYRLMLVYKNQLDNPQFSFNRVYGGSER
jgi:hypothetical protein